MCETILITGGTGFLGSHVVEALLLAGYRLIVVKRKTSALKRIEAYQNKISLVNIDELETIWGKNRIDVVVHLATFYRKSHSPKDIEPMIYTNITFPVKVLELAVKFGTKVFINTGTFFEYDLNCNIISEKTPRNSFNLYSDTKIAFEEILKQYVGRYGIIASTLNLFSPYGPKDNNKFIPMLIQKFLKRNPVTILEPNTSLDFTYCKDIAMAYVKCLRFLLTKEPCFYEKFNVGTGTTYNLLTVSNMIKDICNSNSPIHVDNINKGGISIKADIKKAISLLNWKPKYDLKSGLEETVKYYREVLN